MTEPIPTAGETTIIGMPAITIPINSNADRPLRQDDLDTIAKLLLVPLYLFLHVEQFLDRVIY